MKRKKSRVTYNPLPRLRIFDRYGKKQVILHLSNHLQKEMSARWELDALIAITLWSTTLVKSKLSKFLTLFRPDFFGAPTTGGGGNSSPNPL